MFHQVNSFKEFRKEYPITTIIILINVAMFIATLVIGDEMYYRFGLISSLGFEEPYRLITSAFMHGGIMHLLMNMFSLFLFGTIIERRYKRTVYIILYLLFAILSGIVVLYFGEGLTVGASGAIFAILGFCYVLGNKLLGPDEKKAIGVLIVINLVLTVFMPNVSAPGHFGGLVTGAIVALIIKKI